MDKETLSNYGWVVCVILVLAIMISLATPFGSVIRDKVAGTVENFKDNAEGVLDNMGGASSFDDLGGGSGGAGGAGGSGESITITDGNGATFNNGLLEAMSFTPSAPVSELQEVKVDGTTVDPSNYDLIEETNAVIFKPSFAATLASGSHSVDIISASGTGSANFEVTKALPDGAIYYSGRITCDCGSVNNIGETYLFCEGCGYEATVEEATQLTSFPATPKTGDWFYYNDFEYCYNRHYEEGAGWVGNAVGGGWGVRSQGGNLNMLSYIAGKPVTDACSAFMNIWLESAPTIPSTIVSVDFAFYGCYDLTDTILLPCHITDAQITNWDGCEAPVERYHYTGCGH